MPAGSLLLPWGRLGIYIHDGLLIGSDWLAMGNEMAGLGASEMFERCRTEIDAYLRDPDHRFALPLPECGTVFQRRVWRALCEIPAGETRTYGALARALESAPRAVAQACRANPWALVVPCHRVVAADGWGGYAGAVDGRLMDIKRGLLTHEGVTSLA
ncbi:hypothetical protein Thpro_020948 [Acidihalobacter prosperus]|uniref:Methylated-DNA-[protein]-cysteine S-methyltransferase DNA binding domain-containing protein n=1 Tax=Acidihalobacter prosperus TaxID=160660 RepID=A0A1A6C5Q6_9GAMM|nr:hypothetical protein Thpro_020948 [Acidihalobacter prosperus]